MCLGLGETVCYFNLVRLKIIFNIFIVELKILLVFNHGATEMKSYIVFFLFLFSFFLLFSSCKKSTEPIYNPQTLQLTVADVSCTEAWLKLKAQIAQKDSSYLKLQLYRNDSLIVNKPLTNADSLLYVDDLQPAMTYSFSAKVLNGSKLLAVSAKVEATTMDTTSHNFTWQTFEYGGQGGSSSFYDVAIIDENDIWAVGEIYTENDKYNAAHWDGQKWELKKITYGGWFWTINTVFAFSHSDVWFSSFVKWNGSRFIEYPVPKVLTGYGLNKIWGTSDNDLYVVGNNGLIAHYDGKKWKKIDSITEKTINDIFGIQGNNFKTVLCAASNVYEESKGELLSIKDNLEINKLDWPENVKIHSVWINNNFFIYACGDGLWENRNNNWQKNNNVQGAFWRRIRGTGFNNIFLCGDFGYVAHFNGITWKSFKFSEINLFVSLAVTENEIVIVSFDPPVIVRGIKNK